MVDFKKVKVSTPEEREARDREEAAKSAAEEAKIRRLNELESCKRLDSWESSFSRSVIMSFRVKGGYLTPRQWAVVDKILEKYQ